MPRSCASSQSRRFFFSAKSATLLYFGLALRFVTMLGSIGMDWNLVNQKMTRVGTVPKRHQNRDFLCENRGVNSLQDRVRERVRALFDSPSKNGEKWTAEKLMSFVGMKTPGGVRKLLYGSNAISLKHLEGFCVAFQSTPAEFVAEPGTLIQPVSPCEAALLSIFRQMTELERRSLLTILQRPLYADPVTRRARLGRAMLSVKEQELVDLYARVKSDRIRSGVMTTLEGAVRDEEEKDRQHDQHTTG